MMVESMLAFPAETEGVGNQPLELRVLPDGTKQFELTAAVTPWEVSPGKIVDAWTYNGMVPGPMIKVDVGDKVRVILHNETADGHRHPLARCRRAQRPGRRVARTRRTSWPPASRTPTSSRRRAGDRDVPRPHPRTDLGRPTACSPASSSARTRCPRGRTISGVTIPDDLVPDVEMPMVVNDAGVIGLSLNGKSFPATAPVSSTGRLGGGQLLQRGLDGPSDAPAPVPPARVRQGRDPPRRAVLGRHVNIAPGERYSVLFQADRPRHVGLALPHPDPRRVRRQACSAWPPPSSSTRSSEHGPRSDDTDGARRGDVPDTAGHRAARSDRAQRAGTADDRAGAVRVSGSGSGLSRRRSVTRACRDRQPRGVLRGRPYRRRRLDQWRADPGVDGGRHRPAHRDHRTGPPGTLSCPAVDHGRPTCRASSCSWHQRCSRGESVRTEHRHRIGRPHGRASGRRA